MERGRTKVIFLHIALDKHSALIRDLEQRLIDRLQLLSLPQQAVIACFFVGCDHSFVQSEYNFMSFRLLLQYLSEKV